jgi:hypothetical protein
MNVIQLRKKQPCPKTIYVYKISVAAYNALQKLGVKVVLAERK